MWRMVPALLLCLSSLVASASAADDKRGRDDPPPAAANISMDEAIAMVERRYQARVVRAESDERNGRRVYVLRLLSDDGRVWTVRVDAATGSVS